MEEEEEESRVEGGRKWAREREKEIQRERKCCDTRDGRGANHR